MTVGDAFYSLTAGGVYFNGARVEAAGSGSSRYQHFQLDSLTAARHGVRTWGHDSVVGRLWFKYCR